MRKKIISNYVQLIFLVALVTVSFVLSPVNGDIKVFSASAMLADYKDSNWLFNVINTWELKSIFSRIYIYIGYKFASLFSQAPSYRYEVFLKIYCLACIIITSVSAALLLYREKMKRRQAALLIYVAFCTVMFCCHLQVEMTCALISMAAFALYVNAMEHERHRNKKLFLAGLLIGSLFFYKSILIILSVSVAMAVFLWKDLKIERKSLFTLGIVVAGAIVMLAVGLVMILLINPAEIQDMLDASVYQRTLFSIGISKETIKTSCVKFAKKYLLNGYRLPIIFIGFLAAICNLVKDMKGKRILRILYRLVLWLMPVLFVIVSNKFFAYHFTVLVFPGIFELLCLKDTVELDQKQIRIFGYIAVGIMLAAAIAVNITPGLLYHAKYSGILKKIEIIIMLICLIAALLNKMRGFAAGILLTGCCYCLYMSCLSPALRDRIAVDQKMYAINAELVYDIGEPCLYLDDGEGCYMLGLDSYLKYYFPLPLQRIRGGSENASLASYVESKEKVLNYNGKYITANRKWFFQGGNNKDIKEMIKDRYEEIGRIAIYNPSKEFFTETSEKDINYYVLYEKK